MVLYCQFARHLRIFPDKKSIMKHKDIDQAMAAKERAELYFAAHPGSPAAVRRPELSIRSGTWVALLGPAIGDGIVGLGSTVETALRAFDAQYLAALKPSGERADVDAGSSVLRDRSRADSIGTRRGRESSRSMAK
jgi:hypothetical protein